MIPSEGMRRVLRPASGDTAVEEQADRVQPRSATAHNLTLQPRPAGCSPGLLQPTTTRYSPGPLLPRPAGCSPGLLQPTTTAQARYSPGLGPLTALVAVAYPFRAQTMAYAWYSGVVQCASRNSFRGVLMSPESAGLC